MMRPRLAPMAARMANSRLRPVARTSSRLATLAQAMSRTRPTAPRRTKSDERTSLTMQSRRGWTAKPSLGPDGSGIAAAELVGSELQLRVGLGEGDAGLEASGGEEEVSLVGAVGIELEGQPDVGFGVGDEGLRRGLR